MSTEKLNIRVTLKNAAKRGLSGLFKDLKQLDKQSRKAAFGMKTLYAQMAAFSALIGGGFLFGKSLKTFADFDDNMRAAAAVTHATTQELNEMKAAAILMGKTTRYTAKNAAEALKFLGMAGFSATQSVKALPGVLNLAAAGSLDLGTAADITTNILTGFGLEVDRLDRVNDVLVQTFTSSNVNLVEFSEAFKMVGPLAKGVGADFEDLSAAVGSLGNAGIKGTMAGTALKNAIDALLAPSAEEAKLFQKLKERLGGVSLQIKDSHGDFIGFKKILEQLEKAGLRGDEALQAFGLRAGPAMTALLNQGSAALDKLTEKLRNSGGVASDIAQQMEAGIGGEFRRTISVLESFQITLGDAFGPEVQTVLIAFQQYLNGIILELEKLKEDGSLSGIGQTIVDIFTVVNKVIGKTIDSLQAMTALSIAAYSALTGHLDIADQAMKGFVKEVNDLFGEKTWDGVVSKPITTEMLATKKALENAAKDQGPIGKGSKKVGKSITKNIVESSSIASKLKASLIKLNAVLETEKVKLEEQHNQKLISLNQYYDKRFELIKKRIKAEQEILKNKISNETDLSKKEILNAQLIALDQSLLTEKIKLDDQKKQEQEKLDSDLLRKKQDLNRKKLQAEQAYIDQKNRIKEQGTTELDTKFQEEISNLQNRQNKELELIRNYHETVIQNLKDRKASELEIERAYQEQKQAIQQQLVLQEREKEQQAADQSLRLTEYKLNNMKEIAAGTSQLFNQLYEGLGKKNKEFFYLAKAAAIAEATINIAQGVTKALAQGGVWGIAQGTLVAAAGAVQIATIASQGYADGGEIKGNSPTKTADNILIKATAGEFMQPVDSVNYYGADIMEALRSKSIPKSFFNNIKFSGYNTGGIIRNQTHFATGGQISPVKMNDEIKTEKPEINIINVTDPSQLDQYLASSAGQDAILNVLGSRSDQVKRILKNA